MVKGRIRERKNRFTVLVETGGNLIPVYLANSGRLEELIWPGRECILRKKEGGLPFRLVAIRWSNFWVSVDSFLPEEFIRKGIERGELSLFQGWKIEEKNHREEGEEIDFLLSRGEERGYLEVKSSTLVRGEVALFPDAPTIRGKRQVEFLGRKAEENIPAFLTIVAQRPDARFFAPYQDRDPSFTSAFYSSLLKGMRLYFLITTYSPLKDRLLLKKEKELTFPEVLGADLQISLKLRVEAREGGLLVSGKREEIVSRFLRERNIPGRILSHPEGILIKLR